MSKKKLVIGVAVLAGVLWTWQLTNGHQAAKPASSAPKPDAKLGERDAFGRPTAAAVMAAASAVALDDSPLVLEPATAGYATPPHTPALIPPDQPQGPSGEDLQRLGYHIIDRYYRMPLAELRQQAARKDAQALTHLAERYLFALDGRLNDPDHEPNFPYREAGREALIQAFMLGNLHAAAMMSESLLVERRPVDAAAWNLVARRAGDHFSADWFLRTREYAAMSPAQKAEAQRMSDALWAALGETATTAAPDAKPANGP